jgi:hypothetical protein
MFPNPFDRVDMHMTPAAGDESRLLQFTGDLGHAGAPDAHHLREKFLGKRQIDAGKVVHSQQPSAGPHVDIVHGVAGGGLLDLRQEELLVFDQKQPELGHRINRFSKPASFDNRSRAGNLDDNPVEGRLVIQRLHGTEGTIGTDHAGFDTFSVFQIDHTGDDTLVREVDLVDALVGVGEDLAGMQFSDRKVRPETIELRNTKTRQKAVS